MLSMVGRVTAKRLRLCSQTRRSIEIAGLRSIVHVWQEAPLHEHADAVLGIWDELADRVWEHLTHQLTYDASRFSKVTTRARGLPRRWLTEAEPTRARMQYLKQSKATFGNGERVLWMSTHPSSALYADSSTNFLHSATPPDDIQAEPERFVELAVRIANALPLLCGTIGLGLEVVQAPGLPLEAESRRRVYPHALRFPAIDVADPDRATWLLRNAPGLDSVAWLTLVGQPLVERLGGAEAFARRFANHAQITVLPGRYATIVRAGAAPSLTNATTLGTVARELRELRAPVYDQLGPEDSARRWSERFDG